MGEGLEPAFVSIEDAAAFLAISRSNAYRLADRGQLPGAQKMGGRWIVAIEALRSFAAKAAELPPAPTRRLRAVR